MMKNTNFENIGDIVKEIKEKINNNPLYTNPCSKEFQEDIKRYGFGNGNEFISWMKQNGILRNSTKVRHEEHKMTVINAGRKTEKEYQEKCAQKLGYKDRAERNRE